MPFALITLPPRTEETFKDLYKSLCLRGGENWNNAGEFQKEQRKSDIVTARGGFSMLCIPARTPRERNTRRKGLEVKLH